MLLKFFIALIEHFVHLIQTVYFLCELILGLYLFLLFFDLLLYALFLCLRQ
jgi:hypothetical protein